MLTTPAGSSKRGTTEEGEETETDVCHFRGDADAALQGAERGLGLIIGAVKAEPEVYGPDPRQQIYSHNPRFQPGTRAPEEA